MNYLLNSKLYFLVIWEAIVLINALLTSLRGHSHIMQSPRAGGGGFRNDYADVIFALSNAEFDYGRGEGV